MCAAVRQRIDVIERREVELERFGAVHAAPAAVAHRRALDGPLLVTGWNVFVPARVDAGNAGEANTVIVPTS